jgi:hypothetical protein
LAIRSNKPGYSLAQVAVDKIADIAFPTFVDLSEHTFDAAVIQFGRTIHRLIAKAPRRIPALESEQLQVPFPPPPVEGDEQIVPLVNPTCLRAVAKAMQHCAWKRYRDGVRDGTAYFYQRGNSQDGLTLRLELLGPSRWGLAEVRGYENRVPTSDEWLQINSWAESRGLEKSYFYFHNCPEIN